MVSRTPGPSPAWDGSGSLGGESPSAGRQGRRRGVPGDLLRMLERLPVRQIRRVIWRIDESGAPPGGQTLLLTWVERSHLGLEKHLEAWDSGGREAHRGRADDRRPAGAHRRREAGPAGHRRAGPLGGDRAQGGAPGLRNSASGALLCVVARPALRRRVVREARARLEGVRRRRDAVGAGETASRLRSGRRGA